MSYYKINPYYSCLKEYDKSDINNLNQCINETTAAFLNVNSINQFPITDLKKNQKYLNEIKILNKKNECNFKVSETPIFVQIPNFFPFFYNKFNNHPSCKEKAKNYCLINCNNTYYPLECKKKCIIQYNAVC